MKINFFLIGALLVASTNLFASTELTVTGIPKDAPISVQATANATDLIVDVSLQPEWHIYGRDVGGGRPVSISTNEDCPIVATGELQIPNSDSGKLTGAVRLRLPIGYGKATDSRALSATMHVQVCDALSCLQPMTIKLEGEIPSIKILLVVDDDNEKTSRIEKWLEERGFEYTTKNYADISAQDCDQHDVILADSDTIGNTKVSRAQILKFPKSNTPLIAVGFNGTRLIEAHQIAMTSGYI